jgi:hypothetical protein
MKIARLSLLFLVLFSLAAFFQSFIKVVDLYRPITGCDPVTLYEKRLEVIKGVLPKHGVIGYVTEKLPEQIFLDKGSMVEYTLTQYALSPLVVDKSSDHELNIGNFHGDSLVFNPAVLRLKGLKNFGDGIVLLTNSIENK